MLGYFDAPSIESREHELVTWLNHNELIGFNTASLAPTANYNRKGRAMAFTGPGIAVDWLDIEGPLHDAWPPRSHRVLFGELPLAEFKPAERPGIRAPQRSKFGISERDETDPIRRKACGPSPAISRSSRLTACWHRSCRRRFDDRSLTKFVARTSPKSRIV